MSTPSRPKPKSFLKRRPSQTGEMALQITSMADVFTILLIFLLKGYASDASTLQPTAGMNIPSAIGAVNLQETVKLEIAQDAILVDGAPVVTLLNFGVRSVEDWKALHGSLAQSRERQDLIAAQNPDVTKSAKLLLVADGRAPWPLLREALRIAQANGFTEPQLAVVRKGE
jgi:hypothetical protein